MGGVAILASLLALDTGGGPEAHWLSGTGCRGAELGTRLAALRGTGVPHASGVGVTGGAVAVEDGAGGDALGTGPLAELIGLAEVHGRLGGGVGDEGVSSTEVEAVALVPNPLTLGVGIAGGAGGVSEMTTAVADGALPLAHLIGHAGSRGKDGGTTGGACLLVAVPVTVGVGLATIGIVDVAVAALAAAVGNRPFTLDA